MNARVDIEEIQSTKTEKFLAGVLAVFLLIAGVWTYQKIDDWVVERVDLNAPMSPVDEAAIARFQQAQDRVFTTQQRASRALRNLEFRREEYRTALDAARTAPRLERAYRQSQRRLASARAAAQSARVEAARTKPAADAAERRASAEMERRQDRRELYTFLFRAGLAVASILASLWLVLALHRRRSRYLPLALGAVAAAAALTFVLAGDYLTDYFDPLDIGVLLLGLFGAAVTVLTFAALQWYIRRRIPSRRVRRGLCPFCGYPARGSEHCEGCGREVVAACAKCDQPRRVGTQHCATCGAA
jgi:lipopolysaccharide export LptBFGC system permease protein LptF